MNGKPANEKRFAGFYIVQKIRRMKKSTAEFV